MKSKLLLEKIEEMHYWDSRVVDLSTNFFGDEITLVYDDSEGDVVYKFSECYEINYKHVLDYDKGKPISEFTKLQLPYFIQNVEIEDFFHNQTNYLKCIISMYPLELSILSKELFISRK